MNAPANFVKTARQIEANKLLGSDAHNILLYGGSRSGKTLLNLRSIAIRALKTQSTHCIIRRTYKDVRQKIGLTSWPMMMELCFPNVPYSVNRAEWFIDIGKSRVWLAGLDDNARREHILGFEFSTIFLNEASEIAWDNVQLIRTRLAEKNSLRNRLLADMNPPSKGCWAYRAFFDHVNPFEDTQKFAEDDWVHMQMNPIHNVENLDENYLATLASLGERERKRFLDGEFSEEDEGHLWKREWICKNRRSRKPENLRQVVVAVDPSASDSPQSDECGIVVVARGGDNHFYILDDLSRRCTPSTWAMVVSEAYHEYQADCVVVETNMGAELLITVMRDVDDTINIERVRATRGKWTRAEPVAALYDRAICHHIGLFPELEEQMIGWNPDVDKKSPDRMDALVWGMTFLSEGLANVIHPKISGMSSAKKKKPMEDRTIMEIVDDDSIWDITDDGL